MDFSALLAKLQPPVGNEVHLCEHDGDCPNFGRWQRVIAVSFGVIPFYTSVRWCDNHAQEARTMRFA